MEIYLPIAEIPVNVLVLLLLGIVTGLLSGMLGVGGGFLTTPFLIFSGIPASVAVSSSANQVIATSFSGFLAHNRHNNVDFKMGFFLLIGGFIGSSLGVKIFESLRNNGQIDLVITICYVFFLGFIGAYMTIESARSISRKNQPVAVDYAPDEYSDSSIFKWAKRLPLQIYFPRSKVRLSAFLPIGVGTFAGIFVSIMGIGGGFIIIPAMIYILGMPTSVVVGTSLFQIIFISCNVTYLYAITTRTVDIVLALILLAGSAIGAQYGTKIGVKTAPEKIRAILAVLVLLVCSKLAYGLFIKPPSIYTITELSRVEK